MNQITIGKSDGKNICVDLDALLRGRMLVQANSGKGKSWLLRRLAEQLFGHVQIIIIDPEGEFATLRERFGFVLVGKGGETPADPRSAVLLAHKLLELRAPAVCDLYEMKPFARHEWVQKFLDAMVDAPKELWHSCVVMVDEAHAFCPEKGAGESCASEAMISLATRGRKRGFACIFATQRLGKLRKDAAAELLNILIGGTFIDIDRKRAADALGVYGTDQREFFDEIKVLPRGQFFALGPAVSDTRILVEVGPVQTTHPEAGSAKHSAAPPPAPEKVKALLPKLADLPKTAEEKAKTEAELRSEIRSLKAQLRTQPQATREIPVADPRAIAKAVMAATAQYRKQLADVVAQFREIGKSIERVQTICSRMGATQIPDAPKIENVKIAISRRTLLPGPAQSLPETSINRDDLTGPERRILKALGELASIGKDQPPREMVAAWSSYSAIGGAFGNPLGALKSKGLVAYPQPGTIALTDEGRSIIGLCDAPDAAEIQRRIENTCTGPERKILAALLENGEGEMPREELAARSGYAPVGGAFGNPLGALRTKGLLDYPRPGFVKPAEWLFTA